MGGSGSGDIVGHEFHGNQWGDSVTAVKNAVEHAKQIEPHLTNVVNTIADNTGGKIVGDKFKLKSESSVYKKISEKVRDEKITPHAALEKMTDLNRYTIIYPNDEHFAQNVLDAQTQLKKEGLSTYKNKQKNYFGREGTGDYIGYNTVMVKGNDKVEIQFHTPESYRTKEMIHATYQVYKDTTDLHERYTARTRMVKTWQAVKATPVGYQNLQGKRM